MPNLQELLNTFETKQLKKNIPDVRPGETVKVHYKIREGTKERIQIFEGLVIGTKATHSYQGSFTVRKVVDGVGVERTFPLHSPWLTKVERVKSGKVRRAKLNFVRAHALSRRFKLKDKGIEGVVWDDPAVEKPEGSAESKDVAESLKTGEDVTHELSGESVGSENGSLGEPVPTPEEVPDPETKLPD